MASVWAGNITLPANSAVSVLNDVELSYDTLASSTIVTKKQLGQSDNLILPGSNLAVVAIIAPSQVPLWLTCGPSLKVLTGCEFTANVFLELLQANEEELAVEGAQIQEDGALPDVQSTRALLVRINQPEDGLENDGTQGVASEIVIYGIWKQSNDDVSGNGNGLLLQPTTDGSEAHGLTIYAPLSSRLLSIFALPLSSAYALPPSLSVKSDPDAAVAIFLSAEQVNVNHDFTQSAKKRKSVSSLDTIAQAKRGRRISELPPGLQRPPMTTSRSTPKPEQFSLSRSKTDLSDYDASLSTRDSKTDPRQQSVDTGNDVKSWRSLKRSSSSMGYRDRDRETSLAARLHSREPSVVSIYPNLHIPDHKQRHRSVTRPAPDTGGVLNPDSPVVSNPFVDKNKPVLQKLIMANLASLGLSRKKVPGGGSDDEDKEKVKKAQLEDDEYKLVYHTVLKSVTFALRKRYEAEVVETRVMKELVEVFGSAYVLGRVERNEQHVVKLEESSEV